MISWSCLSRNHLHVLLGCGKRVWCISVFVLIVLNLSSSAETPPACRLSLRAGCIPQRRGNGIPRCRLSVTAGEHQRVCVHQLQTEDASQMAPGSHWDAD